MKKLVQINVTCNGSTGRIMEYIRQEAVKNNYEAISFFGRGKALNENCKKIDTFIEVLFHVFITRLFNRHGQGSRWATYRLIKNIKKINPDIIQLHNLHGYYINIKMLFKFLKEANKPVIWTLHDCWSFTGHCAHYVSQSCYKWKETCDECQYKHTYPQTYFGAKNIKKEHNLKKGLIKDIKDLTLVVPSNWLKEQVQMSHLSDKNIQVIHNCIDTEKFKPNIDESIKDKYNIPRDKKIILGVAAIWEDHKGLEYFKQLAKYIDNEKEIIVLVGLNKKQIKNIPNNIIGIKRTENIDELIKLYSIAEVFFNPSINETFSMVTLEAISCGVPCVVLNSTATPELINEDIGEIVKNYNIENIKEIYQIIKQTMNKTKNKEKLEEQAQKYDVKNYNEYIKLYDKNLKVN